MALVTDKFRIYAAEAFRNTLASVGSDANKVYLFVGRPKSWGTSDTPPTNEPIDSFSYARTTYSDAVSFKRVDISDTALVIPRVDWIDPTETTGGTGRTYSMYKPDYSSSKTTANGATRLYDSNFYVMNSDFNVYKCLYNGQALSTLEVVPHWLNLLVHLLLLLRLMILPTISIVGSTCTLLTLITF